MTQTQCGNLLVPADEERIRTDEESGGPLLDGIREGHLDLVFGAAVDDDDLQSEVASRRLSIPDIVLRYHRVARVLEQGDPGGRGNYLMQQLQPLGYEIAEEQRDPRGIAARPVETADKPGGDGIGRRREYDRNGLGC